jgi:WD40 repeat protein
VQKPLLFSGSEDGTARLINFSTGKVVAVFRHGRLATSGEEEGHGGAGVSIERPGIEEGDDGHPSIECVAMCTTHPWLASAATDGSLNVWDTVTMIQRHRFLVDDTVVKCAWLPGLPLLAACTADGAVYVWDGRDGKQVAFFAGHAGLILDFAVLPATSTSKLRIITAGDDTVCRVYELP